MTDIHTVVICDVDGCLTDGTVSFSEDGRESLRFHKRDGWLLMDAARAGIEVALVTCDPSEHMRRGPAGHRAAKLGVSLTYCRDGVAKAAVVRQHKAAGKRVAYIGDQPADLLAMEAADVALHPPDAGVGCRRCLRTSGGQGVLYEALQRLMAGEFG